MISVPICVGTKCPNCVRKKFSCVAHGGDKKAGKKDGTVL